MNQYPSNKRNLKLEKQQDKLATLMLEDLRAILKTEVDENLKPSIQEEIDGLYYSILNNNLPDGVQSILLPENETKYIPGGLNIIYDSKFHSVIKNHDIDCSFLSQKERESAVVEGSVLYYTPDPRSWRQWFLDSLGL